MPENEYITRHELDGFAKRIDEHNKEQDKKLDKLEASMENVHRMAINIERLATNMEGMCKEQAKQGERLSKLEERDGNKWREIVKYVTTAIIGIILGYVFKHAGVF